MDGSGHVIRKLQLLGDLSRRLTLRSTRFSSSHPLCDELPSPLDPSSLGIRMDNDTFSSTPTTGSFSNFKDHDNAIRGTIEASGASSIAIWMNKGLDVTIPRAFETAHCSTKEPFGLGCLGRRGSGPRPMSRAILIDRPISVRFRSPRLQAPSGFDEISTQWAPAPPPAVVLRVNSKPIAAMARTHADDGEGVAEAEDEGLAADGAANRDNGLLGDNGRVRDAMRHGLTDDVGMILLALGHDRAERGRSNSTAEIVQHVGQARGRVVGGGRRQYQRLADGAHDVRNLELVARAVGRKRDVHETTDREDRDASCQKPARMSARLMPNALPQSERLAIILSGCRT
jgi:hypothetical protein